jgi:hypothetical protein
MHVYVCLYSSTDRPAIFTHRPINSVLEQVERSCWAKRICKSAHMTSLWGEQSRAWAARGPFFMAKRGCFPVHVHGPSVKSLTKPCQVRRPIRLTILSKVGIQNWGPKLRGWATHWVFIHVTPTCKCRNTQLGKITEQMVLVIYTVSSPWNMVPCLSKTFSWGQFC